MRGLDCPLHTPDALASSINSLYGGSLAKPFGITMTKEIGPVAVLQYT